MSSPLNIEPRMVYFSDEHDDIKEYGVYIIYSLYSSFFKVLYKNYIGSVSTSLKNCIVLVLMLVCVCWSDESEGLTCHSEFFCKVGHRVGKIGDSDDAYDFRVEDDRKFLDFIFLHHLCCLFNFC